MKFIHLTDTHVVGEGQRLFGEDPAARLRAAVHSINDEHGDAAFVVVTGDLTHWGEAAAFNAFRDEIRALDVPFHLMVGNHDDRSSLCRTFPNTPRDANGFVQARVETPAGRFLLMDTKTEGHHGGSYCQLRCDWLAAELEAAPGPVFLFMHHPPFAVGIPAMDKIWMRDADAFHDVLMPHTAKIRHLFFGHVHRPIFGNWRGISVSCMRGLNHQVALDLITDDGDIRGNLEPPAYGVVLINDDAVLVHMHDHTDTSRRFLLSEAAR